MGLTKKYLDEIDGRGWASVDALICSDCVIDSALVDAIRLNGDKLVCDFCKKLPIAPTATAPLDLILELVVDGLRLEYEDPANQMAWDEEYIGRVYDTWDLLWDLQITECPNVHELLFGAIQQAQWCQRNPYEISPVEALKSGWKAFCDVVKHQRRYTFLISAHSQTNGAGELLVKDIPSAIIEAIKSAELVKSIPVGCEWWRVRTHKAGETNCSAKEIGTPPDKVARDNRMSPKGIGVFYGASTMDGARNEVAGYAKESDEGTGGCFKTTVPMNVVDLRFLPPIPSLFDAERRGLRAEIEFLYGFVEDATKVGSPSDGHDLEYIPTQIVAEFIRYGLATINGPVDGILWHSTKDPTVTCCVLFVNNSENADLGKENDTTRITLDTSTVEHFSKLPVLP